MSLHLKEKKITTALFISAKYSTYATVISQIGTNINPDGPALLGAAEIENDTVLMILYTTRLSATGIIVSYTTISKDLRGVDVSTYL
jgi:hypothetical protein